MENKEKNNFSSGYTKGLGFGLVLMLVGVLFLGFNFGFLPLSLKSIVFYWPMILVAVGLSKFFNRKPFSGTILWLIAAFFLIPRIANVYPDIFPGFRENFTDIFWPILLILAGLILIMRKFFGDKWGMDEWSISSNKSRHCHQSKSSDSFSKNSVFGSGEHIILEPEFTGGELNAIFGGITLDLRKTKLPEGDSYLEINAVFGGVTVFLPDDWHVVSHVDAIFGGFEDKRRLSDQLIGGRKLIITGTCIFGGGELKN